MIKNIIYKITQPIRSYNSLKKIQNHAIKFHLGHNKVVGWENGLPIHSLFLPAEDSEPMIRSMAKLFLQVRFDNTYPTVCNLTLNNECNCNCKHCSAYGQKGKELSMDFWKETISQCQELGVFTIILTGGEPLFRKDISQLIKSIDQNISVPVLFTNGYLLKEKAKKLKQAGLNRIFVSIDFANQKLHDNNRNLNGIYEKAIEGIKKAKSLGYLVGISTFVSPRRLKDNTIEKIIQLGNKLKVNEIAIFDEMPAGKYEFKDNIEKLDSSYYIELRDKINYYQSKYKIGIWSYQQNRSQESCNCSAGSGLFKINFNGDVWPCEFCHESVGNLKENNLSSIWSKLRKLRGIRGNKCWLLK